MRSSAASAQDHYLQLDANEKALLEEAKAHFSKVIVVINAGTTLELAELQQDPGISAILWIGLPGSTGIMALGEVLTGAVNPSGHTVDTWAADFTKDPTWFNTGVYGSQYGNRYLNADGSSSEFAFVNYEEGVYVGYRYYETRGYEDGEEWYRSNVVYPFGYGLSYTTFDWAVSFDGADRITAQDTVTATVTVTNTGTAAGKDVAELYYSAPYTPGGIEKSQVVLGGFAKTRLLQPGESDTLTLTLNAGEMASYDYADANGNGFRGYELEAGSYIVSVRSDAHTTVAEHTYTVGADEQLSGETVENRFDDVSAGILSLLQQQGQRTGQQQIIVVAEGHIHALSPQFVWNALYRRSAIGNLRFDEHCRYGLEDFIFNAGLYARTDKVHYLPQPVYRHFESGQSTSQCQTVQALQGRIGVLDRWMAAEHKAM